jgi:hypothetical protein
MSRLKRNYRAMEDMIILKIGDWPNKKNPVLSGQAVGVWEEKGKKVTLSVALIPQVLPQYSIKK